MRHTILAAAALLLLSTAAAHAKGSAGYSMNILIDDIPRTEYQHAGSVYIEAIRGREFAIRLTNPTPYRVAVALSVDGLNTIDARHTDPWSATKWVLDPYESTVITGWQVSDRAARRFYFTGERHSYGAMLGQTQNLGVIEAVFYAERRRPIVQEYAPGRERKEQASRDSAAGAMAPEPSTAKSAPAPSDEYAATGMGNRTDNEVERVHLDLDPNPVASARIRYEFRNELVKLGVIPSEPPIIERREHARGFEGYCPQP